MITIIKIPEIQIKFKDKVELKRFRLLFASLLSRPWSSLGTIERRFGRQHIENKLNQNKSHNQQKKPHYYYYGSSTSQPLSVWEDKRWVQDSKSFKSPIKEESTVQRFKKYNNAFLFCEWILWFSMRKTRQFGFLRYN